METRNEDAKEAWGGIARAYKAYGSPLKPSTEDVAIMEAAINDWPPFANLASAHAIVLGATPALAQMKWPAGWFITGVDNSIEAIQEIWPGNIPHRRESLWANWLQIPKSKKSCSAIVGDGSFIALDYPAGIRSLAIAVAELLQDDGLLVIRCYTQLDTPESVDNVFSAVFQGEIQTIDVFKLRLFMAAQQSPATGTRVSKLYEALMARKIDKVDMLTNFRWTQDAIDTFEIWKNSDTTYTFPTLKEYQEIFREYFDVVSIHFPPYELGDRCPIFVLKKIGT